MKQHWILAVMLISGSAWAADEQLIPLLAQDVQVGCGCKFTHFRSKGEQPLLSWSSEGEKKAFVRSASKLYTLGLRQEKYIPERAGNPKPGDRLVLFVYSGDWQIQVLGGAQGEACVPHKRICNLTRYEGRMLVQYEGGARKEIPVEGRCGCE